MFHIVYPCSSPEMSVARHVVDGFVCWAEMIAANAEQRYADGAEAAVEMALHFAAGTACGVIVEREKERNR